MTIPPPPSAPDKPATAPRAARSSGARPHGRSPLRIALPWALSLALVVAAWGLTQTQKPDDAVYDSFVSSAAVGERAVTRNLAATVTDVRAARTVSDGIRWSADGTWLVVDVDAATVQTQFASSLHADLRIGERLFTATERGQTARQMRLVTGVPRHGSLVFEIPEDSLEGQATVILSWQLDNSADGVIEVAVDLDDVTLQNEITLDEIGWAR